MAEILIEQQIPSAAQQQKDLYNRSGGMVLRGSYSLPGDTQWAILGCTLAGAVVQTDVPTIIESIEALAGITSVHNNFWFVTPATIETADHDLMLHCSANTGGTQTLTGQQQAWNQKLHDTMNLNNYLDTKVFVFVARLPAMLTDVTALEAAVGGVTGIGIAKVLLIGEIPDDVSGASLSLEARFRIDPTPEEE